MIPNCLKGEPSVWYRNQVETHGEFTTFEEFSKYIRNAFLKVDAVRQGKMKLFKLRQKDSVYNYQLEFRKNIHLLAILDDEHKILLFVSGLNSNERYQVMNQFHNIKILDDAIRIALDYENINRT